MTFAAEGADHLGGLRAQKPELVIIAVEAEKAPILAADYRLHSQGGATPPILVISERLSLEAELLQIFDFIPKPLDVTRLFHALAAISQLPTAPVCREPLGEELYREFSMHILSRTGLLFESRNRSALERGLSKRMAVLRLRNCGDYLTYLKRHGETRHELQKLLRFLTVGETYFFRYQPHFEALKERLLQTPQDKPIRIWSAGCSTGEEPYSIAMSIMESLPDWRSRDIRILASDINLQSLSRARQGIYTPWSVRTTGQRHLERFFDRRGESFVIRDEVKRLVQFHHVNLSSDDWDGLEAELRELDAVFCRNVLIYFSPEAAAAMVQRIGSTLKPKGQLFLGHAESLLQRSPDLEIVRREERYYFEKSEPPRQETPAQEPQRPLVRPPAASPEVAPPHNTVADARKLLEAGELELAQDLVDDLLKASPGEPDTLVLKGFIEVRQGKLQEALESCNRAIATDDLNPEAYFLKGVVLEGCDSLAEAADQYRKALLLDHDFIMPRFHMGRLHLSLGKFGDAAREIRNIIRILDRCDEGIIPHSGGVSRSAWIEQLENVLEQVA
jgi:chemotaxis protein methyltransferase CheR